MPISRGRKKGKRKKSTSKRADNNHQEYSSNGVKIFQQGKNVFIKTNRTAKQQQELISRIKIQRPNLLLSLQSSINRAIKIFSEFDNYKLLGSLTYNLILNHKNDDGASELALEYAMSFSTAIAGNPSEEPTDEICDELINLMADIRQNYCYYVMTDFVESHHSEVEKHLRFKTIIESLYMRGSGYPQHIYKVFLELFSQHSTFLKEHYGFDANDILETILQLEDSFCCKVLSPKGSPHPAAHKRFNDWVLLKGLTPEQVNDDKSVVEFLAENTDFISNGLMPGGFYINDLIQYQDLYKITYRKPVHKQVVKALAISFGDNANFLNAKFTGLPLNESLALLKPIIHQNEEYYIFAFGVLTRNIFEITEKMIIDADKTYYQKKFLGNNYKGSRDNYLENKTSDLFNSFIRDSKSYLNLKYKPGQLDAAGNKVETELDLLLVTDIANYLIEMKAGGLSAPSKRGALKSLTEQLAETVGYGAYQSHRAYKYICDNASPEFYDNKGTIVVIDKTKKLFRITITLEHLSGYIANMHELKMLGIVQNDVEFAWTCSLFDLIIFSEILENEDDFIEYLEKRLPLYNNPDVNVDDEIDFLGYFLDNGELVDKKALKKVSTYKLNKTSEDIDNYFQKGGPKPKRKK